jgi:hypothetical protein
MARYRPFETRILEVKNSVALGIWFDQADPEVFERLNTNCGTLWKKWETKPKAKGEVPTLREACNKIIHATKVHYDDETTRSLRNRGAETRMRRSDIFTPSSTWMVGKADRAGEQNCPSLIL